MSSFRIDRISEEVRREVDRIMREEVHDPRVTGTFCVTRADVSRDLRCAKVFVSVLEDDKADDLIRALKSAAGFIRRELGKTLALRYTPELVFSRDKNIAYGVHIASILREVAVDTPPESEQDHEDN